MGKKLIEYLLLERVVAAAAAANKKSEQVDFSVKKSCNWKKVMNDEK